MPWFRVAMADLEGPAVQVVAVRLQAAAGQVCAIACTWSCLRDA